MDLLVSLAYVAAAEGVLDEPLPRGMGLRVRPPANAKVQIDDDGLCEFDLLGLQDVCGLNETDPRGLLTFSTR